MRRPPGRLARWTAATAAAVLLLAAPHAKAQRLRLFESGLGSDTLGGAAPWGNPIRDDRVYAQGIFNQLEGRIGDGAYLRWDGQAWAGTDWNRLWFKSEGRYNAERRGRLTDGRHELLYDVSVVSLPRASGAVQAYAAVAAAGTVPGRRHDQGSSVSSPMLVTSSRTIRSSTSVSQACGLTPFSTAVRTRVVAIAQLAPPASLPANSAALRVTTTGRISRSTLFVSSSRMPSSRNRHSPSQCRRP